MTDLTRGQILKGDNYLKLSSLRYLPRWMVFLIDIIILCISLILTYFFLSQLNAVEPNIKGSVWKGVVVVSVNVLLMYYYKTYSGIIRHSTFIDIQKIFWSSLITAVILIVLSYSYSFISGRKLFSPVTVILYAVLSFLLLLVFRLIVKQAFMFLKRLKISVSKQRIVVLGISDESVAVASALLDNPSTPYYIEGFLTRRNDSRNANILGKRIITENQLRNLDKEDLGIDGVLMIKEILDKKETEEWVSIFLEKGLHIYQSPTLQEFSNKDIGSNIKTLQIEDLLNRKPIKIVNNEIKKRHFNKVVLVTGGAGSIGSEIVNQVAEFQPSKLIVLDQAETPLYDVELEMIKKYPNIDFEFVLADISNKHRLETVFKKHEISMVYHAAAYKHVPLIEKNPHEAILVNILGTKNLATLASQYKINRFVMVSTDKAVNPTNVMGASKRSAELLVQALQHLEGNTTKFITTRFGNVLGSNGSVIPHFKRQIEAGGPITVTHPDIVRYFMTIPEACELVLQAGTMGSGGEIYVFDMGEPVKIVDLARRMIMLSGLEVGKDIEIIYTGLRPGEKLYEELLSDNTKNLPTHHEKIMISKDPNMPYSEIESLVNQITKAAVRRDKDDVVRILKQIVPEYKSNNSEFEKLDQ